MWSETQNAEAYEEFAQAHFLYRQTAQRLISLATFAPEMTVIDLACGTGIVTELLVDIKPELQHLIAVDRSAAMLAIARQKPLFAKVQFYQSRAEELSTLLPQASVDVVLCNSAFWQMPVSETLAAIHCVLRPHGQFILNGPERGYAEHRKQSVLEEAFKDQILHVAQTEYGYIPTQKAWPFFMKTMRKMSSEQIRHMFASAGFEIADYQMMDIEQTATDVHAFFHIPIMSPRYLRGLDHPTCMEILDKAYQRLDHSLVDVTPWGYHVLVKK